MKIVVPSLLYAYILFAPPALFGTIPVPPESAAELQSAHRAFEATLYQQAIPLYKNLLNTLHSNTDERARVWLNLAKCHFYLGDFSEIPLLLAELPPSRKLQPLTVMEKLNHEARLLLGLAQSRLKNYETAAATLGAFLAQGSDATSPLYETAAFELGCCHFQLAQYGEAKKYFAIPYRDDSYAVMAQIHLGRIAAAEKDFPLVERILANLNGASKNEELVFALHFLQGDLHFQQAEWDRAAYFFEKSLPPKNGTDADWREDALYKLGWSYLNLGKQGQDKELFTRAGKTLDELKRKFPSDRTHLAWGHYLLARGVHLSDQQAFAELETYLSQNAQFSGKEARHQALMLRAEASPSYDDRKKFFRQLTHESNLASPNYPNAWYLRGLNELDRGIALLEQQKNKEAARHCEHAAAAFNRAFALLWEKDKLMAAQALKHEVQAHHLKNTRQGYLKALALIGKLLNQYRDSLFPLLEAPDEIYYLQGLSAAQLIEGDEEGTFFRIAESSLVHNRESYPTGAFAEDSIRLLGTLYFQQRKYAKAHNIYMELPRVLPDSPFAGQALLWASNCLELTEGDPQEIKELRGWVVERYPDSPVADEAFFRAFSYQEYLKGNEEALGHLREFQQRYPRSPYAINAHYLLGIKELQDKVSLVSKGKSAAAQFDAAARLAEELYDEGIIPQDKLGYFAHVRFRSLLDKAGTLLLIPGTEESLHDRQCLEQAEETLSLLFSEIERMDTPLAKELRQTAYFESFQEECANALAECSLSLGKYEAAERILKAMLKSYQANKITRGYYLAKVWYHFGELALRQGQPQLAIEQFAKAEDAAKGKVFSHDEMLDLWIQQAAALRALEKPDEAMLLLSQVINSNVVSPCRLKAMFLRAEIYEEQGRLELARRQLESIAKMAGPWALKAKNKLEENYVYQ